MEIISKDLIKSIFIFKLMVQCSTFSWNGIKTGLCEISRECIIGRFPRLSLPSAVRHFGFGILFLRPKEFKLAF